LPKGHRFTPTEDLLAKSIAKQYEKRGYSKEEANSIGYATVTQLNKNPSYRRSVMKKLRER
jgi:hypothetical protein